MPRTITTSRTTGETDIALTIDLDGTGVVDVSSGVGFFDHMLSAFARHGLFDLTLRVTGDTQLKTLASCWALPCARHLGTSAELVGSPT